MAASDARDSAAESSKPAALIKLLQSSNLLTANGAAAAHEEMATTGGAGGLIRRLLELNVNSERLAQGLAIVTDYPCFPNAQRPSERDPEAKPDPHPGLVTVGSGQEGDLWVLAENGLLYFVDPFDARSRATVVRSLRSRYRVDGIGVISKAAFTNAASLIGIEGGEEDGEFAGEGDTGRFKQRVKNILLSAVRQGASDIHYVPHPTDVRVFFRVENRLKQVEAYSYEDYFKVANVILTRCPKGKPGTYLSALDDQFAFIAPPNRTVKVRVMMIPTTVAEVQGKLPRFCLRIPNAGIEKLSIGDLGIPDTAKNPSLTRLRMLMERKNGLILVSGPTGSGKTTTLMAIMAEMQRMYPDKCRYTVEDPVEMSMSGVSHVQVDEDAELTFARAIKSFLRGDPDEIMVGEIRDLEVGALALTASITGHLTFATIHTNSAIEVIARLIDMGCASYIVADAMRAATAQRLVRRICPHCGEEARWGELINAEHPMLQHPDNFVLKMNYVRAPELYSDLDDYPTSNDQKVRLHREKGCGSCGGTGYRGRCLVTEVLEITPGLAELISKNTATPELRRYALRNGFKDMWQHGATEVFQRRSTTFHEMVKVLGEREKFSS